MPFRFDPLLFPRLLTDPTSLYCDIVLPPPCDDATELLLLIPPPPRGERAFETCPCDPPMAIPIPKDVVEALLAPSPSDGVIKLLFKLRGPTPAAALLAFDFSSPPAPAPLPIFNGARVFALKEDNPP